ncbi:MAG TPA: DUF3110 domain-containing protein [Leptolyngbyaceae cyanobacterium M65_K2018_010]|nr:DUF3110 domain-containing protein [Leptolyngbyaceae cyanobacterium M65_K2018_010]
MVVYVLLFNARTENEGIHTLKVEGQDVVLMFENEDDACRFGLMLEAQDFPAATVEALEQEEIEEFCQGAGYECKLVPEGFLAIPPEQVVEQLDWDPNAPSPDSSPWEQAEDGATNLSQSDLDRLRQQFENLL